MASSLPEHLRRQPRLPSAALCADDTTCHGRHRCLDGHAFHRNAACGTFAAVGDTLYGPAYVPGSTARAPRTAWTPVSVTPDTDGDLSTLTTSVTGGGLTLTQRDEYRSGDAYLTTSVSILPPAPPLTPSLPLTPDPPHPDPTPTTPDPSPTPTPGVIDLNIDTDGDGLPDAWEDGSARAADPAQPDLSVYGARPDRPDLFAQVGPTSTNKAPDLTVPGRLPVRTPYDPLSPDIPWDDWSSMGATPSVTATSGTPTAGVYDVTAATGEITRDGELVGTISADGTVATLLDGTVTFSAPVWRDNASTSPTGRFTLVAVAATTPDTPTGPGGEESVTVSLSLATRDVSGGACARYRRGCA